MGRRPLVGALIMTGPEPDEGPTIVRPTATGEVGSYALNKAVAGRDDRLVTVGDQLRTSDCWPRQEVQSCGGGETTVASMMTNC